MPTVRQTPTQLAFVEALDRLLSEQNHQPVIYRGGTLVVKSVEVRSENMQALGAGAETREGGTYHWTVRFTQHGARRAAPPELPEGYDADATAEEGHEEIDAEVVLELPAGEGERERVEYTDLPSSQ